MSFGLTETIESVGDRPGATRALLIGGGALTAVGVVLLLFLPGPAKVNGGLLLIGGLVMLGFGIRRRRITTRLHPGVLDVPSRTFYLGSRVPARYRRLVKQGTTDTTALEGQLVLKEWVRYQVGTDTRTISRDILTIPVPITRTFDGRHVAGDLELTFPAYPPSFEASNNKVQWELRVHATFPDGFTEDSVVPLWLVPAGRRSDLGDAA